MWTFCTRVCQRCFIPPSWRVTLQHRIEVQLLVAFAQQQHLCAGCHVVTSDWFRVVRDVAIGFIGQVSQIFFTGLCARRNCGHEPDVQAVMAAWPGDLLCRRMV